MILSVSSTYSFFAPNDINLWTFCLNVFKSFLKRLKNINKFNCVFSSQLIFSNYLNTLVFWGRNLWKLAGLIFPYIWNNSLSWSTCLKNSPRLTMWKIVMYKVNARSTITLKFMFLMIFQSFIRSFRSFSCCNFCIRLLKHKFFKVNS